MKKALTKVFLVALMAILPLSFYAQKKQTKPVEKYFYIFAEGGLSVNHTDLANYGFVPFYQEGNFLLNDGYVFNNFDGQLGLGYQFGKVMGVNAKFGTATLGGEKHGQLLTDFNEVEDQTMANKGFEDAMLDKTKFMEANLNLTFNLTNLFFGYNPRRVFNFIPHVGIGGIRYHAGGVTSTVEGNETPNIAAKEDAEMTFTVPVGAELNFNLARKLDFFIDYTFTFAGNDRLDQVQKLPDDIQVINDMYSSVNAGLRFKFNKKPCNIDDMCPRCIDIQTEPAELSEKDGAVSFDIVYDVPAEYFEKEAVMHIVPTFTYPGGSVAIAPVDLVGQNVEGGNYQVNYKMGGKHVQHVTIPFVSGMENAKLTTGSMLYVYNGTIYADNQDIMKNAYFLECCNKEIASGVSYTPPVIDTIKPEPKHIDEYTELGKLFFDCNKTTWKPNSYFKANKKMMKDINDLIAEDPEIKEVVIRGWASPEGTPETDNNGLAGGRGETVSEQVIVNDNVKVTVVNMGVDRQGFIQLLKESKDFSDSEKKNIETRLEGMSDSALKAELYSRKTTDRRYEKILSQLRRAVVEKVVDKVVVE